MTFRPLPGDPATVRRLARTLAAEGDRLRSLAAVLRGLGAPGTTWQGAAALAFRSRAAGVAGVVERVSRRYAVAAVALQALASRLEECQAQVAVSQRLHDEWHPVVLSAGEAMSVAEASGDPAVRAQAPRHRERMVEALEKANAASARHDHAWTEYRAADRACASVLRGLLGDGLADTWRYDLLTGTGRAAEGVSDVAGCFELFPATAGPARAVSLVGSGVAFGADVTVKLAYGDGSWRSIGGRTAAGALGVGGDVLKAGGRVTNAERIAQAPTRRARRLLRPSLGDRLGAGVTQTAKGSWADLRSNATKAPWRASRERLAPRSQWLAQEAAGRSQVVARETMLDDLARVARTPGTSPRMYTTGVGSEALSRGVDGVNDSVDRLDELREEGRRRRTDRRNHGDVSP